MNIENVPNIYQLLHDDGVLISYQGAFQQEIIEEITSIIDFKLSNDSETKNKNKYLTMFVELSQNILRYSSETLVDSDGKQSSHGVILVGVKENSIFVISGNPVSLESKHDIEKRMEFLTSKSKEELNTLFKDELKNTKNDIDNNEAGLGLIDIIRKSDKTEYHIINITPTQTFFTLKVEYFI